MSDDGYAWSMGGMESDPDSAGTSPRPPSAGDVPEQLGPYRLLEEIGQGGMGTVFRALDTGSGDEVALKLIAGGDPHRALRLRREGDVAASLSHPGIVRALDGGEQDGHSYLVYELVEGARPIDTVFASAPLGRRIELLRDAARALGHAHDQGVLHRDVKPGNILIDSTGTVRVTDFGQARARGRSR